MQRDRSTPATSAAAGWKIFRLLKPGGRSKSQSLSGAAAVAAAANSLPVLLFCITVLLVGAAVLVPWINNSAVQLRTSATGAAAIKSAHNVIAIANGTFSQQNRTENPPPPPPPPPSQPLPLSFSCPAANETRGCREIPSFTQPDNDLSLPPPPSCPKYFRWIHEDLRPWRSTGITKEMVERCRPTANFRLVVLDGQAYVERYRRSFQTRDVFTQWGIVQLLRRYPGRIPDLDIMFDTVDWPVVNAADYRGRNSAAPPPLFRYCGDDSTLDIVFPDWSFWGRRSI